MKNMVQKHILTALSVLFAAVGLALTTTAHAADRDTINIVGSSTVYPFATTVAERFGKTGNFKTPKIESTGTGGGMKLFCAGVGIDTPDITNASRAIKSSERDLCTANGVKSIMEVKIGYDGIVMANSKEAKRLELSQVDIYRALAKEIADPKGSETLVPNPYKTWKQVNPMLPDVKIEVIGPPPSSGTRDAFAELAVQAGCDKTDWLNKMKSSDEARHDKVCRAIREDGYYIEAGENDNLIVQKLQANKDAVGIFGYSFLEENSDKVQPAKIKDTLPTFKNISDFSYPLSRPLFFYVKMAHVDKVPGIKEYVAEFTSAKAMGDEGYLADKGLINLSEDEFARVAKNANAMKPMTNFQKLP